jgi:excinuclease UvrABC ATPase subunit
MTELNDHMKLLFARAAQLYCRGWGRPVRRDTPDSILEALLSKAEAASPRALITFPVRVPENFTEPEVVALLEKQGYTKIHRRGPGLLEVVQDRVRLSAERPDSAENTVTPPAMTVGTEQFAGSVTWSTKHCRTSLQMPPRAPDRTS